MNDREPKSRERSLPRRAYRSLSELHDVPESEDLESGTRLGNGPAAEGSPRGEFPPDASRPPALPVDGLSRRRFLSLLGASAALAAGATSCSKGSRGKVVSYTKRPLEVTPGVATWYASTFSQGIRTHGVLVKTREGRPIHVEGNDEHPHARGKAPLHAVADLLGLYDPGRLRGPSLGGNPVSWKDALDALKSALLAAKTAGRPVLLLTHAVTSPTRAALLGELKKALPTLDHLAWEPCTLDAEIAASKALYGEWRIPQARFDRAEVVVSFSHDFLGADSPGPLAAAGFASRRRADTPQDPMNRLWVFEGTQTITGSNADDRVPVRPSRTAAVAFAIARALTKDHALPLPQGVDADLLDGFEAERVAAEAGVEVEVLRRAAADLARVGRGALVLAGPSLPPEAHAAAALIHAILGAEGHTIDASLSPVSNLATLAEVEATLRAAAGGRYAAAIFWGPNPAHAFPALEVWLEAAAGIPFKTRIGLEADETAASCQLLLAENHWLESWGDAEPALDLLGLQQPAIEALGDTRQGEDILIEVLRGLGAAAPQDAALAVKERWEREVFPSVATPAVSFEQFWSSVLHDGVFRRKAEPRPPRVPRSELIARAMARAHDPAPAGAELVLSPSSSLFDGRYASNGWLEELPDSVTKLTWGNALQVSIPDAAEWKLADGDLVAVSAGLRKVEVPVIVQPGQARGVLGLSLGHGRRSGAVASGVGVNASPFLDPQAPSPRLRLGVTVAPTGNAVALPRTQEHHRMEGRDLARSTGLAAIGTHAPLHHATKAFPTGQKFGDPKWGMVIDLAACTGCSNCVIACQSENNIPVVGPEQVLRGREMHWIRIDRYYEGEPSKPSVVHQPILCQHCDNAPCETVCPVNATTHSPDGLNQMTYNRCVGTRYCANNCPYKVRRFNFLDFTSTKREPETLVFNPEVTIRPRGVMEKCTFCVQRIEDARMRARLDGRRPIRDGEIRPACAAACPTEAIRFGNLADPQSEVSRRRAGPRGYRILEELGVEPAVTYLAHVHNPALPREGPGHLEGHPPPNHGSGGRPAVREGAKP